MISLFVLARAVVYAALFVGFLLVFLPARILAGSGIAQPPAIGPWQFSGMFVGAAGAALALLCILSFVFVGRGTPAPFDPPRRLVAQGPYRVVRNPMYIGADLALLGASLFYESWTLLGYAALFAVAAHLLVVSYEEPTLRRTFGTNYERTAAARAAGGRSSVSSSQAIAVSRPPDKPTRKRAEVRSEKEEGKSSD